MSLALLGEGGIRSITVNGRRSSCELIKRGAKVLISLGDVRFLTSLQSLDQGKSHLPTLIPMSSTLLPKAIFLLTSNTLLLAPRLLRINTIQRLANFPLHFQLIQVLLPKRKRRGFFPAHLLTSNTPQNCPDRDPHEQVEVFAHKHRHEQPHPAGVAHHAAAADTALVAAKQVHNGRGRDTPQPREDVQGRHPRTNPFCADRVRALVLRAQLEEVGPQLDPVIDEEPDRDERPHGRKERQVAELDDHLGDVVLDIVHLEGGLFAHTPHEHRRALAALAAAAAFAALNIGDDGLGVGVGVEAAVRLICAPPCAEFEFDEGKSHFFKHVRELARDGKGDDFVAEAIGVRAEVVVEMGVVADCVSEQMADLWHHGWRGKC